MSVLTVETEITVAKAVFGSKIKMPIFVMINKPSLTMNEFKRLLLMEAKYQLSSEMMDRFVATIETLELKRGDILVRSGEVNPHIYIVKEGICAYTYMNGLDFRCSAFALPGSLILSSLSYYFDEPAFFQIEACCESTVMKVNRERFDALIAGSHEFARWIASMAHQTLYYQEYKQMVINGDAIERFKSLVEHRPEIIRNVSNKLIASYLGITQQYLSMLKRRFYGKS